MRIEVPWSTTTTPVEVDERRVAGVLSANVGKAADPEGILRSAVTAPGAAFEAFLDGAASPLLVVANDATRPTPTAEVLRVLRPQLEAWLAAGDRTLDFVVATGTHRVALPEELDHIFGADLVARARRPHPLPRRQGQGRTGEPGPRPPAAPRSSSTACWPRPAASCSSTRSSRTTSPATRAGASRCSPASPDTRPCGPTTSCRCSPGSELLMLEGNPVHEDLMEQLAIGIAGKQVYSIQLVLDEEHHVGFAAAGDLEDIVAPGHRGRRQAVRARDRAAVRGGGRRGAASDGLQLLPDQQGHPERGPRAGGGRRAHRRLGVPVRSRREPDLVRHARRRPNRPPTRLPAPTSRSTSWACSRPPASRRSSSGGRSGRSPRSRTRTCGPCS